MKILFYHTELTEILTIALILIAGILVLPICIGYADSVALINILGLITSVLIFQPFAIVIGFGLGFHTIPLMLIMCSIGLAIIFGLGRTCDMFADRSEWLGRQLGKVEAIAQKSRLFKKYGMMSLILLIWVPGVGLYGCVMIAWLFRWRGARAVTVIFAAWMLAILIVLLASMGILAVIL